MRGASKRHTAMRRCGMRPLPVPVSIMLALILALGLCAACSGGPPRDHLDAAAIDVFFDGLAEEKEAQKAMPPPIFPEDGIDKFYLRDLHFGRPVPDAKRLSPGETPDP